MYGAIVANCLYGNRSVEQIWSTSEMVTAQQHQSCGVCGLKGDDKTKSKPPLPANPRLGGAQVTSEVSDTHEVVVRFCKCHLSISLPQSKAQPCRDEIDELCDRRSYEPIRRLPIPWLSTPLLLQDSNTIAHSKIYRVMSL